MLKYGWSLSTCKVVVNKILNMVDLLLTCKFVVNKS